MTRMMMMRPHFRKALEILRRSPPHRELSGPKLERHFGRPLAALRSLRGEGDLQKREAFTANRSNCLKWFSSDQRVSVARARFGSSVARKPQPRTAASFALGSSQSVMSYATRFDPFVKDCGPVAFAKVMEGRSAAPVTNSCKIR